MEMIYKDDAVAVVHSVMLKLMDVSEDAEPMSEQDRLLLTANKEICTKLKQLQSAQPERKKGKWIKISPANIYECSICGQNVMTNDIDCYHYCHGCGVDMRGE